MGANVTKVDHNTISMDTDINGCYLTLQMETRNFEHIEQIRNKFVEEGFKLV
jgi:threonine dehydratase